MSVCAFAEGASESIMRVALKRTFGLMEGKGDGKKIRRKGGVDRGLNNFHLLSPSLGSGPGRTRGKFQT